MLAPLGVVAITLLVYRELAVGVAPLSSDHNLHLLKIRELHEAIGAGRLFSWSDAEGGGTTVSANYPFLPYLLPILLDLLPGVSATTAYAWTILAAVLLQALGVYAAARLHFSRAVGVLAGLRALFDPGDWWIGGHFFMIGVGVWVSCVAALMTLLAIAVLCRARSIGDARTFVAGGLLLGLATLAHPVAIVFAAAAAIPLLVALVPAGASASPRAIARAVGLFGAAFLATSAFWLIPFFASGENTLWLPYAPLFFREAADRFWSGALFDPRLAPFLGVSLCGLLLLARRTDAFSRFIVIFVPVAVVFSIAEVYDALGLLPTHHISVVELLQLQRLYLLVRPLIFIAFAFCLCELGAGAARAFADDEGPGGGIRRALLSAVAATLIIVSGGSFPGWPTDPAPQGLSVHERAMLERALDTAGEALAPGERVALFAERHDHSLVGPAVLRGFRILKMGHSPTSGFRVFESYDPEVLARSGASILVSRGPPPAPFAQLPPRAVFDPFEVRRLETKPAAWITKGPGVARVLSWEDGGIRIALEGTSSASRLAVMQAYDRGWRERGGREIRPVTFDETRILSLSAEGTEVTLAWVGPRGGWLGAGISLAAALVCWSVFRLGRGGRVT